MSIELKKVGSFNFGNTAYSGSLTFGTTEYSGIYPSDGFSLGNHIQYNTVVNMNDTNPTISGILSTCNTSGNLYVTNPNNNWLIYDNPIPFTNNNNNNIMQNKVAVFKVTRDENQKITSTTFLKEMWIESKNGSSIDFEVAKDSEINKFEANEIVIRVIYTVTF